jgi:hypothetical protein
VAGVLSDALGIAYCNKIDFCDQYVVKPVPAKVTR